MILKVSWILMILNNYFILLLIHIKVLNSTVFSIIETKKLHKHLREGKIKGLYKYKSYPRKKYYYKGWPNILGHFHYCLTNDLKKSVRNSSKLDKCICLRFKTIFTLTFCYIFTTTYIFKSKIIHLYLYLIRGKSKKKNTNTQIIRIKYNIHRFEFITWDKNTTINRWRIYTITFSFIFFNMKHNRRSKIAFMTPIKYFRQTPSFYCLPKCNLATLC